MHWLTKCWKVKHAGRITMNSDTIFHEGDMADEIVEHLLLSATVTELLSLARTTLDRQVKSWPPERVREVYEDLQGGDSNAL